MDVGKLRSIGHACSFNAKDLHLKKHFMDSSFNICDRKANCFSFVNNPIWKIVNKRISIPLFWRYNGIANFRIFDYKVLCVRLCMTYQGKIVHPVIKPRSDILTISKNAVVLLLIRCAWSNIFFHAVEFALALVVWKKHELFLNISFLLWPKFVRFR